MFPLPVFPNEYAKKKRAKHIFSTFRVETVIEKSKANPAIVFPHPHQNASTTVLK